MLPSLTPTPQVGDILLTTATQGRARETPVDSRITEVDRCVRRDGARWLVYDDDEDGFIVEPHPDRIGCWIDVARKVRDETDELPDVRRCPSVNA